MSLPADNQEAFRQAVKAAQAKRGNYLTEAEMIRAAEMMGAPDPFPIGMAVSNQVPVAPPKTREQIGRANMREDMQRRLAEREAGIRAYESQTGNRPGQSDATREAIFSNRVQNLQEGQGIVPDKRAAYILQQRENESARNRALAATQQYVDSQPSALMQLEDYRDPRGAFARKMQERAFGLREQQMAGESADRASELGLRREGLDIEREKVASGERVAVEANRLQVQMADNQAKMQVALAQGNRSHAASLAKINGDLQAKLAELQLDESREGRTAAATQAGEAREAANEQMLTQAYIDALINDKPDLASRIEGMLGERPNGLAPTGEAPIYPDMNKYLDSVAAENETLEGFMDNIRFAAADSPAEHELIKQYALRVYGADAFRKFDDRKEYDFGWLRNALGSRGYATQKQNRRRGKMGLPQNEVPEDGFLNRAAGAASAVNPLTAPTTLFIKALSR
jgi:hypothetical protein